jgi:N-acetylneuraminic acid mutarotase
LLGGGGEDNGLGSVVATGNLRIYNPQTQAFEDLAANLTYATINPSITKLSDGRVLFCGGVDATGTVINAASIFDPTTDTTSSAASMSSPRTQHTATLLSDGRVFITGGVESLDTSDVLAALGDILSSSSIYNPGSNTWSSAASMSLPRIGHAATLLPSGKVLISGGLEIASVFGFPIPGIVSSCMRYNPGTNSMQSTAAMSGSRALHGQIGLSTGRVLVGGGADGDVLTQVFNSLDTCRLYNEATNTWSNVASMPQVRTFTSLVEAGGMVHAVSGVGTIDLASLSGIPVTDIASAPLSVVSWSTTGAMVYPRALSNSIAIEGGERILTLGPGDSGGGVDLSGEIFIP